MKVVKAAAQVLNTLWQYRELRNLYKQVRTSRTSGLRFTFPCFQQKSDCSNSPGFGAFWLPCGLLVVYWSLLCRTAGTTLTLSRPSPLWSETGTSHSPRCPPAPCGPLLSSFQVAQPAPPVKCCVRKRQNFLFRPVFFLRGQRHVLASHAGLQETQFELPESAVIYATGHLLRGQQFTQAAAHRFA